jgi:hypothetical protein
MDGIPAKKKTTLWMANVVAADVPHKPSHESVEY